MTQTLRDFSNLIWPRRYSLIVPSLGKVAPTSILLLRTESRVTLCHHSDSRPLCLQNTVPKAPCALAGVLQWLPNAFEYGHPTHGPPAMHSPAHRPISSLPVVFSPTLTALEPHLMVPSSDPSSLHKGFNMLFSHLKCSPTPHSSRFALRCRLHIHHLLREAFPTSLPKAQLSVSTSAFSSVVEFTVTCINVRTTLE